MKENEAITKEAATQFKNKTGLIRNELDWSTLLNCIQSVLDKSRQEEKAKLIEILDFVTGNGDRPPSLYRVDLVNKAPIPMGQETEETGRVGKLIEDYWSEGIVVRLLSAKFGTHDFVLLRFPGTEKDSKLRAVKITPAGVTSEELYYSSYRSDKVIAEWPTLRDYFKESIQGVETEHDQSPTDHGRKEELDIIRNPKEVGQETGLAPCPFCDCVMEYRRDFTTGKWTSHPRNDCILAGMWFKPEKWNHRVQGSGARSSVPICRIGELARFIKSIADEKDKIDGMMAGSTALISIRRHSSEILQLLRDIPFEEKIAAMESESPAKPEALSPQTNVVSLESQVLRAFTASISHGDEIHRAWLAEACEAFIAGKPLPPPRDAKGLK